MAEPVPARCAQFIEIPLRHHIMVPQQNAIKSLGRGNKILANPGKDDALDKGIYRGAPSGTPSARKISRRSSGSVRVPSVGAALRCCSPQSRLP